MIGRGSFLTARARRSATPASASNAASAKAQEGRPPALAPRAGTRVAGDGRGSPSATAAGPVTTAVGGAGCARVRPEATRRPGRVERLVCARATGGARGRATAAAAGTFRDRTRRRGWCGRRARVADAGAIRMRTGVFARGRTVSTCAGAGAAAGTAGAATGTAGAGAGARGVGAAAGAACSGRGGRSESGST